MFDAQYKIKKALHKYLESGDSADVIATVDAHSELIDSEQGEYPDCHRVMDLIVGGRSFRVCRWISKGEKLFLVPTDRADPSAHGVPLWLSKDRLKAWAEEEDDNPSQGATDWEQYR